MRLNMPENQSRLRSGCRALLKAPNSQSRTMVSVSLKKFGVHVEWAYVSCNIGRICSEELLPSNLELRPARKWFAHCLCPQQNQKQWQPYDCTQEFNRAAAPQDSAR